MYANNHFMIAIFLLLGLVLPIVAWTLSRMLRPSNPTAAKRLTYESGVDPFQQSWLQFNIRYYMFALLFIVFDVEAVFLYPWAVAYNALRSDIGLFILIEMGIFVFLLVVGLIYAWKKKVLEWD
ncbi:NADH-quinone oxidoreductase subunit A [Numidum massiliense]|uniref:NADH-quinone oxidoreductase subunit A n=1 Tax=Numidum massiliense TaxID=1522315 RepID=UPI0006D560B0|nr:NADH-quinone oxidoreductase subunit A [Numidum massiliense]